MKIHIIAKTKSKVPGVEKLFDGTLEVRVRELPIDGKANDAVRDTLAEYHKIPKSRIRLIAGGTSKYKTFIIDE
jgi:uncharacterized protein YggU (UPF0235/DUF167 family)